MSEKNDSLMFSPFCQIVLGGPDKKDSFASLHTAKNADQKRFTPNFVGLAPLAPRGGCLQFAKNI
jgi:hypothetical protein